MSRSRKSRRALNVGPVNGLLTLGLASFQRSKSLIKDIAQTIFKTYMWKMSFRRRDHKFRQVKELFWIYVVNKSRVHMKRTGPGWLKKSVKKHISRLCKTEIRVSYVFRSSCSASSSHHHPLAGPPAPPFFFCSAVGPFSGLSPWSWISAPRSLIHKFGLTTLLSRD